MAQVNKGGLYWRGYRVRSYKKDKEGEFTGKEFPVLAYPTGVYTYCCLHARVFLREDTGDGMSDIS